MKNILLIIVLNLTMTINGQSPNIQFSRCIGSPQGNDSGHCILQTSDGGYIVACTTGYYTPYSPPNGENGDIVGGNGDGFRIFKLSPTGSILWQTYINGTSSGGAITSTLSSMVETNDGAYIVMGQSDANNWGSSSFQLQEPRLALAKISSNGAILWQKYCQIDQQWYEVLGNSIKKTNDGGFIIVGGFRYSTPSYAKDYFIVKIDSNGNLVWSSLFGTYGTDIAADVIQCPDGGYLINGTAFTPNSAYPTMTLNDPLGNEDIMLIKVSSTGNYMWSKRFGGSGSDYGGKLINTSDGGYIFTGSTSSNNQDISYNHGGYDNWIVKINSTGVIEWEKTYGGTSDDSLNNIIKSNDGNYIFVSSTKSNNGDVTFNNGNNKSDAWIVKINPLGVILWQKTFGGTGNDDPTYIKQTNDGGYAITGSTSSPDGDIIGYHSYFQSPSDIMVVKFSQDNLSTDTFDNRNMNIYPNPVNNILQIQTPYNSTITSSKVLDISGKLIFEQNNDSNIINTENLAKGFYILEVLLGKDKYMSKFIKE